MQIYFPSGPEKVKNIWAMVNGNEITRALNGNSTYFALTSIINHLTDKLAKKHLRNENWQQPYSVCFVIV
jgi:hypothetical protein